jgi:hypothetical protein
LGRGKGKRGVNKERGGDIVIVISSNRIRAISQIQKQIEIKDIKNTNEEKINTSTHTSIRLT